MMGLGKWRDWVRGWLSITLKLVEEALGISLKIMKRKNNKIKDPLFPLS